MGSARTTLPPHHHTATHPPTPSLTARLPPPIHAPFYPTTPYHPHLFLLFPRLTFTWTGWFVAPTDQVAFTFHCRHCTWWFFSCVVFRLGMRHGGGHGVERCLGRFVGAALPTAPLVLAALFHGVLGVDYSPCNLLLLHTPANVHLLPPLFQFPFLHHRRIYAIVALWPSRTRSPPTILPSILWRPLPIYLPTPQFSQC